MVGSHQVSQSASYSSGRDSQHPLLSILRKVPQSAQHQLPESLSLIAHNQASILHNAWRAISLQLIVLQSCTMMLMDLQSMREKILSIFRRVSASWLRPCLPWGPLRL
jgi:hypothetical protein